MGLANGQHERREAVITGMIPLHALMVLMMVGVTLCVAGFATGATPSGVAAVTNRPTEFTFTSGKSYGDSFNDVELDVVFTAPDQSQQRVPAFWAGGNTWRVRYASNQAGV